MIDVRRYSYDLSLSSQFYFCSLPLRFDTYSKCQFACDYCFARSRGGQRPAGIKVSDTGRLARRLQRLDDGQEPRSVVDEFLTRRMPVHLGGMADPFPPMERHTRITAASLEVLARHRIPAVISTKGVLCREQPWLDLLKSGRFHVQMSLSTIDDGLAAKIERSVPPPSERLSTLEVLAAAGIATSCRLQPLLPGCESEAFTLVDICAKIGVRHVAVEHLKLPVDDEAAVVRLDGALNTDLQRLYRPPAAIRIGREWVLDVTRRLPLIREIARHVRGLGMTFGAADTDLLHMSDGTACCSGADLLWPDVRFFRFNYLTAIQKHNDGIVTRASLGNEWAPGRSVANSLNSKSRLPARSGVSPPLASYIDLNWNGRANGASPALFYGLRSTGEVDDDGFTVYQLDRDLIAFEHHLTLKRHREDSGQGTARSDP